MKKIVLDVNVASSSETLKYYQKAAGEEEVELPDGWTDGAITSELFVTYYDIIKEQPGIVYGMTKEFRKSADYYTQARKLVGLDDATDPFLATATYSHSASKKFINNLATIVIEYDIGGVSKYRQTFELNKANQLVSYKLEEVASRIVVGENGVAGPRENVVFVLGTMKIEYK